MDTKINLKNKMIRAKPHDFQQKGFTLVELMVGMVINIFMIGVAFTYFVSTTQSYKVQNADGRIQENARIAFELLSTNLRRAGNCSWVDSVINCEDFISSVNFRSAIKTSQGNARDICTADRSGGISTAACLGNFAVSTTDPVPSDRISVLLSDNQASTACLGVALPANEEAFYMLTFWADDDDGDGVSSLWCEAFQVNKLSSIAPTSLGASALMEGIDSIQAEYGVDSNNDGIVDAHLTGDGLAAAYATTLAANPAFLAKDFVKTIKIAVLVSSGITVPQDVDLEDNVERTYNVLDAAITFEKDDPRSRELKQIFSTTIAFKN